MSHRIGDISRSRVGSRGRLSSRQHVTLVKPQFETRPRSERRIDTAEQSHELSSQGLRDLPRGLEERAQLLRLNGKLQRRLRRLEQAAQQGERIEQTTIKGNILPPPRLSPGLKRGDSSNVNSSSTLSLRRDIVNQERNEADRQAAARTRSGTDSYYQLGKSLLDLTNLLMVYI
ncbi:hypothetical protein BP6252_06136 [Coleophoma cylindrospora]|uniref:Uncharacterized protein n=1 Tax=Coleophoma cylindrospora TaxID=1849047 RepID=A0A3D8RM72_9HELO|nr:hypothetical protein BP6252_06136 [Coleophoma cylindrospora]